MVGVQQYYSLCEWFLQQKKKIKAILNHPILYKVNKC